MFEFEFPRKLSFFVFFGRADYGLRGRYAKVDPIANPAIAAARGEGAVPRRGPVGPRPARIKRGR
jgi:hypothetical protein